MATLSFGEWVARSAWRAAPQRALSALIGWGARRRLSPGLRTRTLDWFVRKHGIDVAEAERSLHDYAGLQDFFTRRLRAGARPVDTAAGAVVSPADGRMVDGGQVAAGRLFDVKGGAFALEGLLADATDARRFEGGAYFIIYLSPRDYHRVHSPIAGEVVEWRFVPGRLFPVNDRSVAREPGLFAKNERLVILIEGEVGRCAVVMVAAVGVGHITAAFDDDVATHRAGFAGTGEVRRCRYQRPRPVARGAELGVFNLGSTAIVVFEPGRVALEALPAGALVKMGARIGGAVLAAPIAGAA